MPFLTYRRRFTLDDLPCEVRIVAGMDGLGSTLLIDGSPKAYDATPAAGPEAVRNHCLATTLADGSQVEVEAGYRNLWDVAIAVRRDGALVHESHPGATIAYPASMTRMTVAMPSAPSGQWQRNKLPLTVDIASGLFFFVVAKQWNLTTAALAGAVLAIVLVVLEKITKKDLTGGLVLFGVMMSLIAAGFALAFQTDEAVKWRTSVVGAIAAVVFLSDGLLNGGRWLGRGLARYMPFALRHQRMAIGMGLTALLMAGLNLVAMRWLSTDAWLVYHSFLDNFIAMGLAFAAMGWARDRSVLATAPDQAG
jgi:intracellular septation protein A